MKEKGKDCTHRPSLDANSLKLAVRPDSKRKPLYHVSQVNVDNTEASTQNLRRKSAPKLLPKNFENFIDRNYNYFLQKGKENEDIEKYTPTHVYSETGFMPKISENSKRLTENRDHNEKDEVFKVKYPKI
jgi:hypothetical protein